MLHSSLDLRTLPTRSWFLIFVLCTVSISEQQELPRLRCCVTNLTVVYRPAVRIVLILSLVIRLVIYLASKVCARNTVNLRRVSETAVTSVPACRDALCNGTLFLPDARIASNILDCHQAQPITILRLSLYLHISHRRQRKASLTMPSSVLSVLSTNSPLISPIRSRQYTL